MELDIQLKTNTCNVFFSIEPPTKLWGYSIQKSQDWNHEYVLVERTVREYSVLFFHVTVISSYITDKKWTDEYVSGLERIANGLQQNEERILNFLDTNKSITSNPLARLEVVTKGKCSPQRDEELVQPVNIIEDFLQKETATTPTPTNVPIKKPTTKTLKKRTKKTTKASVT